MEENKLDDCMKILVSLSMKSEFKSVVEYESFICICKCVCVLFVCVVWVVGGG